MNFLKRLLPLVLILVPGLAWSELRICNRTGARHAVAIGYKTDQTWVSEGWWNLNPGDCVTPLKGDLEYRYYYYRAQAAGHRFVDQNYAFCTRRAAFTIEGGEDCAARGYDRSLFRQVDTGDKATSFTLSFAGGVSVALADPQPPSSATTTAEDPPDDAPGTWGEPYASDSALFQGCVTETETPFCSFHADGTKFFVYDDGRTPPGLFRSMQGYPPGTPIELRGDLEAIHDRTADIVLRRVLPRRWNRWDSTLEKLQGSWYSLDDPNAQFTIVGSELVNDYDGSQVGREYLSLSDSCGPFEGGEYLVRRDEESGEALCYSIEELGAFSMTLMYLPRANLLEYRKLD